jgi:3-methyl-2-oxobutanoate hydroxymethyltransferase
MKRITVTTLQKMKEAGEKIVMSTCYDASFAAILAENGVETMLVGDSLGMVFQGLESTLPVEVDQMIYHSQCVARGCGNALLITDMPFMSYSTPELAMATAGRILKEGGAHMVKLEGGSTQLDTVARLTDHGIPVCAHLGLLPQSVHKTGGYKVQGRDATVAAAIREDAQALQQAGAQMLVLECVPAGLATEVSSALQIPVIGIGAGNGCDGQVQVLYDLLGITRGRVPSFSRNFMADSASIEEAVANYVAAVKSGDFPDAGRSFQ